MNDIKGTSTVPSISGHATHSVLVLFNLGNQIVSGVRVQVCQDQ